MKLNLAYILMDDRQYDRSIRLRDEALLLRPNYSELWRTMWLTMLRAGRYAEATVAVTHWARGTGRNLQAATHLGHLLEQYPETGKRVELPKSHITCGLSNGKVVSFQLMSRSRFLT